MIQFENVTYSKIIKNFSFKIEKGVFFICGPSGSGKTTILKLISGLISPEKGKIKTLGSYGFYWQTYNLLPLKGKDNIILPFLSYKKKLNKKRLNYLIDTFNVSFLEKDIENLSSGEKERIGLIKAFIHQPEIVILDEAGNHLDKNLKTKLENLINKYSQNHIVVLTSHLNRENLKINLKLCLEK